MIVCADKLVLTKWNEGGVDDDFDIGEEDRCRCVRGKRRNESIEQTLVKTSNHPPHHPVPVAGVVREGDVPALGRKASFEASVA